ncbi:MAG TPA: efflux RND transporter permease subunit, partial [Nitrosomonas sp.]|nr:efflux RND transporter permease subunit [Nitrosomonas sp.]
MKSSFITKILHRPIAVSMFYGILVVGGLFAFWRLPLELTPQVEFPKFSVITSWSSTSAETVEKFVTSPIEEIANTVQGVRKVNSVSEEGRSTVDIEFDQKTDMNFARLEMNEKLAAFTETLPAGVSPPVIQRYIPKDFQNLQGFLSYSLSGKGSSAELKRFAEETILPSLMSIKGIADIQVLGGEKSEIHIDINPANVLTLGVNLEDITSKLRELNVNASVGAFSGRDRQTVISAHNTTSNLDEIENLIVAKDNLNNFVRLRDIACVSEGLTKPTSFYRINGKPSITIIIDKEPNVNMLRLAEAVFEKIESLSKQFPSGFKLIKESDKSEHMGKELKRIYQEILISILCILLILTLFLRSVKSSFLILSSILLSIAGTFLVFWIIGIGLNLLTIAGLVLGFGRLVDDSIVVLDNIHRKLGEDWIECSDAISRGVYEIALPVVASTLTTVGALLPLEFLPQDIKPYFLEFGIAVGISLLMSLLVSFTIIPVASGSILIQPFRSHLLDRIGDGGILFYRKTLFFVLRRKKIILLIVLWMFGLPLWLLPGKIETENIAGILYNNTIGSEFYQGIRTNVNYIAGGASHLFFTKVTKGEVWDLGSQTYLTVTVEFPQGTEIEYYNQVTKEIEREALQDSVGIEKITSRVWNDYAVVRIDIKDKWANLALPYILKNRLIVFASQTGGSTVSVSGFGPGFYSGGESSPSFSIKVLGYDYNKVKELAEQFRQTIEQNPRVAEVDIDRSFGRRKKSYEYVVTLDRDIAARNGLTVDEILRTIRTYTRGEMDYSVLTIGGRLMSYSLKFNGYEEFSVDDLRHVVISNSGKQTRLADIIKIGEKETPAEITRENQQYLRWVSFEYKGPYRFGKKYVDETIKAMVLPNGYMIDKAYSLFSLSDENQSSLLWVAFFGFIIVFMITASLYESFQKPFVVIFSIPFSFIGLFLSFYIMDVPFGKGGYAAVILLIGIVVTNSVVLVDHISYKISHSGFSNEVLLDACSHRLRPIVMTSLATIGGLLPLLVFSDQSSLWYQLSLGTIGGMVSSTILTLFIVPVVYSTMHRKLNNV